MIRVFSPKLTYKDKLSVFRALVKNEISGSSNELKKFESLLTKNFDRKYAVALANGSAALDVAFQTLDLKKGDEVILPAFTIISCLSAVIRTGATPVFCDVDKFSWNMRLEDVEKVFTKNTRAVLVVHTYGLSADAEEIQKFCNDKNLILIEDASEAHGQMVKNKKCGSFGNISTLSFYANKHVTTGEGGAILTNNYEISKKARQMINLDFNNQERFKHNNLYWNYRLTGLQAALGISQLKRIDKTIKMKIIQGNRYLDLLKKYNVNVQVPLKENKYSKNHFWVFGVVLNNKNIRDLVITKLEENHIETRPFFWPLHLQPALIKNIKQNKVLVNTEFIAKNGLYLPLGSKINKRTQKKIVLAIKSILENEY
jgi:perosamine synthetase